VIKKEFARRLGGVTMSYNLPRSRYSDQGARFRLADHTVSTATQAERPASPGRRAVGHVNRRLMTASATDIDPRHTERSHIGEVHRRAGKLGHVGSTD
jgi:hypothetical protein